MIPITLNKWEYQIVTYVATTRFNLARGSNKQHVIYGIDEIQNEINSYGAEFAFCKYNNCYPDLSPGQLLPHDATINGITFDIKQTHRRNGNLLVRTKEVPISPPDFYVLMIGERDKYFIVGMISGFDVLQEKNIRYDLPFPAYFISQNMLMEFKLPTQEFAA